MFGTLVNNKQLQKLIQEKEIEIDKFESENLGLVHYTLHSGKVKVRQADGLWKTAHDFNETNDPFVVPPNGYVIVEIKESIKLLNDYIVGEFRPASNLIEDGFGLTSGKIDKKYGTTGEEQGRSQERVVFGMKNFLDVSNEITKGMRIAHVVFFDLRGVSGETVELSKAEIHQRLNRLERAMDDGVAYE